MPIKIKGLINKKIICTVTNDLYRDRRMIRICHTLGEYGADVTLIGIKKKNSLALSDYSFNQKRLNLVFNKGILFYFEYNLRLFWFLLFNSFDIVNAIDTDSILACFLISRVKRKEIIFDAHEFFIGVPELHNKIFKKSIWNFVEKIVLSSVIKNYTVSNSLKNLYEKKTGQKYKVIRNLPLKSRFKGISPKVKSLDKIVIVYVGALNKGRGLENSIEMMKYFDENVKLLLIGGGDLEEKLKNLVKELKLEDKVTFTGWVLPESIPDLMKDAHIGLNLLEDNSQSYRVSLANKVFDYIHLGIPCITMDFDEYNRINSEYHCFALVKDIEPLNIFNIINRILNDKDYYTLLSNNSRKAAIDLHWDKEKDKLLDIYM